MVEGQWWFCSGGGGGRKLLGVGAFVVTTRVGCAGLWRFFRWCWCGAPAAACVAAVGGWSCLKCCLVTWCSVEVTDVWCGRGGV